MKSEREGRGEREKTDSLDKERRTGEKQGEKRDSSNERKFKLIRNMFYLDLVFIQYAFW